MQQTTQKILHTTTQKIEAVKRAGRAVFDDRHIREAERNYICGILDQVQDDLMLEVGNEAKFRELRASVK